MKQKEQKVRSVKITLEAEGKETEVFETKAAVVIANDGSKTKSRTLINATGREVYFIYRALRKLLGKLEKEGPLEAMYAMEQLGLWRGDDDE